MLLILFLQCNSSFKTLSSWAYVSVATFYQWFRIFKEWFQFLYYDWFSFSLYFANNMTSNAVILYRLQHIINGFISRTYSCPLRKVSWSVFKECSSRRWFFQLCYTWQLEKGFLLLVEEALKRGNY